MSLLLKSWYLAACNTISVNVTIGCSQGDCQGAYWVASTRFPRGGFMRADHVFKVIDVHAGGAPSRLVYSGIPPLVGETMMEKMRYFEAHHDWIRRSLVLEPRGGSLTSAVVLMPPSRPGAHIGAFFMEAHGYLPMCGSD